MTNGIRAFLPGSLVDLRPVKDTTRTKARPSNSRSSSSTASATTSCCRVARCWKPAWAKRQKLLETLHEGAVVRAWSRTSPTTARSWTWAASTACCTSPTWPGAVSVTRPKSCKWVRKSKPRSSQVRPGKSRVAGRQAAGRRPWVGLARRYPQGTRLFGKVTNLTDYGAFVEVEAGIEGLVHVSEMDWTNKNVDPRKVVTLGEEVEVMVLEIDEDRRRISLGMKQCRQNPWEEFATNFKRGDKVRGAIKSITDFGVFVGLPGGIDGLVHLSDLSWTETGEEAVRKEGRRDRSRGSGHRYRQNASRWASSSWKATPSTTSSPRQGRRGSGHHQVGRSQGRSRCPWTSKATCALPRSPRPRRRYHHRPEGRREHRSHDRQHRPQDAFDPAVDQGP